MAEEKKMPSAPSGRAPMRPEDYKPELSGLPGMMCRRCGVKMEPADTYFEYLDHNFHTELLRCPKCGEVYIPEDLAKGKMAEVEGNMEDK